MSKTYSPKISEIKRETHKFDATDEVLGRLATKVVRLLMGKNKPTFANHENVGDRVIVTNVEKIRFTGNKLRDKLYIHHTGFPKGLRQENLRSLLERKPAEVFKRAVSGMLPKNRLRRERVNNLKLVVGNGDAKNL